MIDNDEQCQPLQMSSRKKVIAMSSAWPTTKRFYDLERLSIMLSRRNPLGFNKILISICLVLTDSFSIGRSSGFLEHFSQASETTQQEKAPASSQQIVTLKIH